MSVISTASAGSWLASGVSVADGCKFVGAGAGAQAASSIVKNKTSGVQRERIQRGRLCIAAFSLADVDSREAVLQRKSLSPANRNVNPLEKVTFAILEVYAIMGTKIMV
jgi:hypothetical protein